jgi:precorrin-2 dehydrogenase/sirohydrochlorin ferrochelatase
MDIYYPVFLQLKNKLCVVIGGGEVASRKVDSLLECHASVRVVAPAAVPPLRELAALGRVEYLSVPYTRATLDGAYLAVAATDNPAVNRTVAAHCREQRIPVNVVDAPELCDFILPATIRRGPLTLAVSTGGTAPAVARQIRRELEEKFDDAYGELLTVLGETRIRVLNDIADADRRKHIFTTLARDDLLTLLREKGRPALEDRINELIGGS